MKCGLQVSLVLEMLKNRFRNNNYFSKSPMKPRQLMLSKGSIMESANCPDEISESYSKINDKSRTKLPSKHLRIWTLCKKNNNPKPMWKRCEKLIICSFLSFSIWRSTWDFPHGFPILQRCFWRGCHWKQWGKFVCQVSGLLKCDNHAFSLLTENIPEVCYFSIQVHKLHIRYLQNKSIIFY